MSTDTVPARTPALRSIPFTADEAAEITNLSQRVEQHAASQVLDHAKVHAHTDWRQVASEWVGLAAAFTAAAGVGGLAFNVLVELSTALAVVAGALVGVLVWLLAETRREGRRWVYAETDDPYDGDPAAIR